MTRAPVSGTRRACSRVSHWPAAFLLPLLLAAAGSAPAQEAADSLQPVVVTGTRTERRAFDLPMSVDVISRDAIQEAKPRVNVSEDLNRAPGTFVQNRENFAQELQITIRGFGARSQFGTRGVKLIVDGLPASSPDGQGNPGVFDLGAADRIEVLRGPFSALYGNHSGGVVQVFSETGATPPAVVPDLEFGSYGFQRYGLKGGGASGAFNGFANVSYFSTDGYRDHSAATKTQFSTKLGYDLNESNRLTLVATAFNQPDAQDPLGLTQAQVQQNPRQAQPVAIAFNTQRSLDNLQGGLVYDSTLGARDSLRVVAYAGSRSNEQFLAVPIDAQLAASSSGGVSSLDRQLGGGSVRWTHRQDVSGGPLTVTSGVEYDGSTEARQGFINNFGVQGALKRDEDNIVDSLGAYLQADWQFSPRWSVSAGVRYTTVEFTSEDHYIAAGNPDDSGSTRYAEWTPTLGLVFSVTPTLNVYASYGRSFETPTSIELAYRPDGASGLNFSMEPSISNQLEVGAKAILGAATRINVAVFSIQTQGEIVIARNTGGRSSYQNSGDSSRLGAELMFESDLGAGLSTHVALTLLNARFDTAFRTCAPLAAFCNPITGANTAVVPSGNRIPGVPNATLFADLAYRNPALGLTGALEVIAAGSVPVNDFNSEYAAGYTIANLWAGLAQQAGRWRFREFARANNLFGREYIGAVIVGDANGRYYAPAPTRNFLVGASATYTF